MRRLIRRGATMLALSAALAAGLGIATVGVPAIAAGDAGGAVPPQAAATDIAIPYLGTEEIKPAPPWRVADCAAVLAQGAPVVGCEPDRIALAAPDFDPDAGVRQVQVPLTDGTVSMTVAYRVTLAPPAAPLLRPVQAARPVASGSLLRVPIADLGISCTACTAASLEVLGVEPSAAGSAWATPTHVVFRSAEGFTGPVEVHVRVADDHGTPSADATVYAGVTDPSDRPLLGLDRFVPLSADGTAEVDLAELAIALGGGDLVVVGCGAAMHGQVACDADGRARYTGVGQVDQFSVQLAADGAQATASVTLVPDGTGLPATGLVPAAPPVGEAAETGRVRLALVPPVPVDHDDAVTGIFTPFVAALDRVGAR
ncbi:hypothetical protein ACGGZK_08315 [Agromyces sp. MMS24-K17]|uniref:hypothetical protein n=1 Tax=Agromyces sp. MMS24-K17 TaxID=3372850 RepID=UPI0037543640